MNKKKLMLLLPVLAILTIFYFNSCKHEPDEVVMPIPEPTPEECDTSNVTYMGSVYPIFQEHCLFCHSGPTPQGGLDFTDYNIVAFLAKNGILTGAINHDPGFSAMPKEGNKLSDCKIRTIEIWVRDTTFTEPEPEGHACDPDTVYFELDLLPILVATCGKPGTGLGCHDETAPEGVRLDSYAAVINSDVVKPFDVNDSKMWEKINETDPEKMMPPPGNEPLNPTQKGIIQRWIQQGALNLTCDEACDTTSVTFTETIWKGIIQKHCYGCHSGANAAGGIHFESYADVSAHAMIPPGQPGSLLGAVTHSAGNSPMPKNQPMLNECKISQVQKWVNEGAPEN